MEDIDKMKMVYSCYQTKVAINERKKEFVEYAALCLENEDFVKMMNKLLPLDNVAQAKLKISDGSSPVRSIGLLIMRMDPERPLFSLGISIEIAGRKSKKAVNSTIFIAACRTLEELREYVKSDAFSVQIDKNISKQVEDSFSGQVNNL